MTALVRGVTAASIDAGEIGLDASLIVTVLFIPSDVRSNIQERTIAIGKPMISSIITKVTVQSGNPNLGSMISAASMMIKAVAAYMVITLMTFLRLSSRQNWDSLLGLLGIMGGAG